MIDSTETETATKQPMDDVATLEKRAHESIDRLLEQKDREQRDRDPDPATKLLLARRGRQLSLDQISAPLLTLFGVHYV